jgi:hypothetical protein
MNSTSKIINEQFEDDESDDLYEIDKISTINSLFNSIETKSNQHIKFLKDDGELLAKKYEEKFENLEFKKISSNNLRLLLNDEYIEDIRFKKGNEKEYKNIKSIRELSDIDEFTLSMELPISFKYEIFKINTLGSKFSLTADIEWIPKSSNIIFKLSYKKGSKIIELDPIYLKIPNYSEVLHSYKAIIITIMKYLKENIIKKIETNYEEINKLLNENLLNYVNNLDK